MTDRSSPVIEWLLESDPAIRWQVKRDLIDETAEDLATERQKVARQGWGAELLSLQEADGRWDGGTYRPGWADETKPFFDAWTATHFALQQLREFGIDPAGRESLIAMTRVRENVTWEANGTPYFDGESEPCINGVALANGAYFGESVDEIVPRLLAGQLGDGGWNCWAEYGAEVSSFHTTICVLEGLSEWERVGGQSEDVSRARHRGEEYLLERRLFRSLSTGRVVDPRFTMFSYPGRWYYDVLRALDYFRATRAFELRMEEAVELVRSKQDEEGRWALENTHQGPTLFEMEGPDGFPSRWNTLRALRVLRWAE